MHFGIRPWEMVDVTSDEYRAIGRKIEQANGAAEQARATKGGRRG
jgi:hypothetical protein